MSNLPKIILWEEQTEKSYKWSLKMTPCHQTVLNPSKTTQNTATTFSSTLKMFLRSFWRFFFFQISFFFWEQYAEAEGYIYTGYLSLNTKQNANPCFFLALTFAIVVRSSNCWRQKLRCNASQLLTSTVWWNNSRLKL